MRIEIIRCDWCGSETKYDSHNYTTITYASDRPHWTFPSTEKYCICNACDNEFVVFFTTRTQKVDAK